MTLFTALAGGAFDRLNWHHSREFDPIFLKKSNVPGFAREGAGGRGMGSFGIGCYIFFFIQHDLVMLSSQKYPAPILIF